MPKIIFQPLMIANPRGAWRALILLLVWRAIILLWAWLVIIKFKVQCSKFKVKMAKMNILLRHPCPRSFRSS